MRSPRSEFTTLQLISSNEVCGEHEIAPRLIQNLLENISGRCWPRSPRYIVLSRNSGKFQIIVLQIWVHRQPFRHNLAGIFRNFELLAFHCRRSKLDSGIGTVPANVYFVFFTHIYFLASGQPVVTGFVPFSPRFLPSIFIAHRIRQSH